MSQDTCHYCNQRLFEDPDAAGISFPKVKSYVYDSVAPISPPPTGLVCEPCRISLGWPVHIIQDRLESYHTSSDGLRVLEDLSYYCSCNVAFSIGEPTGSSAEHRASLALHEAILEFQQAFGRGPRLQVQESRR